MSNEKIFIRQGDILFESVPEGIIDIDDNMEKLETKTVALGEITGHHHSFRKDNDQVILYKRVDEDMPSQVSILEDSVSTSSSTEPAELTHQEHLSIQLPKGEYIIRRERSYNPFLKQIQMSID